MTVRRLMVIIVFTGAWLLGLAIALRLGRGVPPRESLFSPTGPGVVTLAYLVALNTFSFCPGSGWCSSYGFPLRYYSGGDQQIVMNGVAVSPFEPGAFMVNLLVSGLVLAVVQGWVRARAEKRRATAA